MKIELILLWSETTPTTLKRSEKKLTKVDVHKCEEKTLLDLKGKC